MTLKSDFEIDFEGLNSFLKTLTYCDYQNELKIKKGTSICDINRFAEYYEPLNRIIAYGMPFLVDAIGNDLSVCILTKKRMKLVRTIIDDCSDQYGSCLNGYWMIPPQFINLTKNENVK